MEGDLQAVLEKGGGDIGLGLHGPCPSCTLNAIGSSAQAAVTRTQQVKCSCGAFVGEIEWQMATQSILLGNLFMQFSQG